MREIDAVLTFAMPFRHGSVLALLGGLFGGTTAGIIRHARARQDTKLQLETTDCLLTAW